MFWAHNTARWLPDDGQLGSFYRPVSVPARRTRGALGVARKTNQPRGGSTGGLLDQGVRRRLRGASCHSLPCRCGRNRHGRTPVLTVAVHHIGRTHRPVPTVAVHHVGRIRRLSPHRAVRWNPALGAALRSGALWSCCCGERFSATGGGRPRDRLRLRLRRPSGGARAGRPARLGAHRALARRRRLALSDAIAAATTTRARVSVSIQPRVRVERRSFLRASRAQPAALPPQTDQGHPIAALLEAARSLSPAAGGSPHPAKGGARGGETRPGRTVGFVFDAGPCLVSRRYRCAK